MISKSLAAAAISVALGASAASAEIVQVTYAGTLYDSFDLTGVFGGGPGSSLDGDAFSVTYTFDTSVGNTGSDQEETYAYGGSYYQPPVPSPAVIEVLTINGEAIVLYGGLQGEIYEESVPAFSYNSVLASFSYSFVSGLTGNNILIDFVFANPGVFPAYFANLTYNVPPGAYAGGSFDINAIEPDGSFDVDIYGEEDISTVTIAVPEPSTWAMMLLGFAGLGLAGYRWGRRLA